MAENSPDCEYPTRGFPYLGFPTRGFPTRDPPSGQFSTQPLRSERTLVGLHLKCSLLLSDFDQTFSHLDILTYGKIILQEICNVKYEYTREIKVNPFQKLKKERIFFDCFSAVTRIPFHLFNLKSVERSLASNLTLEIG